ncbi:phosphopantetheinyl transferase [Rhizobium mongolense]|uniref:Phosphopantetheinyl transferase n=2 Tax=Rhizobium mongolense TaxID=57676 RepID=A0ABR6IYS0_9HYPH|nr:phosphopantetheinyl transferase [Rhizobium mongolense]TVZ74961.1 phosphopantetheinyl transferase [Rhizobium mongolense USDA 1844]
MRLSDSNPVSLPAFNFVLPTLVRMNGVVVTLQEWSPKGPLLSSHLGSTDKGRLAKLKTSFAQAEFIAGRTALYHAALALGVDVSKCNVECKPWSGKPYLDARQEYCNFSIAHTPGLACCVASSEYQVGCDCERWNRSLNMDSLSFLFGKKFRNQRECLVEWTKLEALLKLRGLRLADVVGGEGRLTSSASDWLGEHRYSTVAFDLNATFVVSYCAARSDPRQICGSL